jgi:predicted alpha/beta hydrolase family esterase
MKTQVVVIHGGDAFSKYDDYIAYLKQRELTLEKILRKDWKMSLQQELGDEFEVIAPQMPNKQNARYTEWVIVFEKVLKLLDEKIILVGHSLGGIFLAKYLAENKISQKILGTILVAAPFDTEGTDYELCDFALPTDLSAIFKQSPHIILYQSKDDKVVPFKNALKYKAQIPHAELRMLEGREHFHQTSFPELVSDIKSLVK